MNIPSSFGNAQLGRNDLSRIASILRDMAGIELPTEKVSLVQARLSKRLRHYGFSSYAEYCDLLESSKGADEKAELLTALTTNVTKFFRENHHFKFIEDKLMDDIRESISRGRPVRIWSAACSTGEEPYSIAMTILRNIPDAHNKNIKIYATDIDHKVVSKAEVGEYKIYSDGPVSREDLRGFFDKATDENTYRVKPNVKKMVSFSTLNLHDAWPARGNFDIIFCRNVVIYFNKDREHKIWKKFSDVLRPGGYLFIGHSERIPSDPNVSLKLDGVTTYVSTK